MGKGNDSGTAELFDFETGRRRREREARRGEVHRRLHMLLAGNRRAAAWLYDTFAPSLYRRLRLRYGHVEGLDANDVLHDSYLLFLQRDAKVIRDFLDRVEPEMQTEARLESYLWDLACGVASNRRRSAAALPRHQSLDSVTDRELFEDHGQEGLLLDRDALARLDSCLQGRGSRLYLYFKLRFRDGYTPDEIVKMTGWSQKTTYKLRQDLNEAVRSCAEVLGIETSEA